MALFTSTMEEAERIGKAIGMADGPSVEKMIEMIQSLGAFKMSMLQDAERGKSVEIDALLTTRIWDWTQARRTTVSKNVSKGAARVLVLVVAVLVCVAPKMWQSLSGNELKNNRFRPSPPV